MHYVNVNTHICVLLFTYLSYTTHNNHHFTISYKQKFRSERQTQSLYATQQQQRRPKRAKEKKLAVQPELVVYGVLLNFFSKGFILRQHQRHDITPKRGNRIIIKKIINNETIMCHVT
jgi:hypothetical protein